MAKLISVARSGKKIKIFLDSRACEVKPDRF